MAIKRQGEGRNAVIFGPLCIKHAIHAHCSVIGRYSVRRLNRSRINRIFAYNGDF